jgi:hypothetical protein
MLRTSEQNESELPMSTKSMFFRMLISEFYFLVICIVLFIANLAFWLDERGIAENIFNIQLTPSLIPLYIMAMIFFLAFIIFALHLYKKIKTLRESHYKHSRGLVLLMAVGNLLAISGLSVFVFTQDANVMKTVIPSLFSLFFAIMFIIYMILFFALFGRSVKLTTKKLRH